VSLLSASNNSQNAPVSTLDRWLVQADIFAEIFRRETVRARWGSQNELRRASAQLRACLDKIDEILGENHHAG